MLKRIIINKKRPWLTDLLTILINTFGGRLPGAETRVSEMSPSP